MKEKFASLTIYADCDDFSQGAIDCASGYSRRVCEYTGRPGRTYLVQGWYTTVDLTAPDALLPERIVMARDRLQPLAERTDAERAEIVRAVGRRTTTLPQRPVQVERRIPLGWSDLAEALLRGILQYGWVRCDREPPRLKAIFEENGTLQLDALEPLDESELGALAFARAMTARLDPLSGHGGPVDDRGLPPWQQHVSTLR